MQALVRIAGSPAFAVFLGTLPLLGTILWGLIQNDRRLTAIDQRLNRIENKLDAHHDEIGTVKTRVAVVETRLDGPRLVS